MIPGASSIVRSLVVARMASASGLKSSGAYSTTVGCMTNAAAGNLMIVPEELRRGLDETLSWRPYANSAHARPRLVLGASCGAPARSRRRDFRNRRGHMVRRLVHQ